MFYDLADFDLFQLPIGAINPGESRIIWMERTVNPGADIDSSIDITLEYELFTETLPITGDVNAFDVASTAESLILDVGIFPSRIDISKVGRAITN